MVFIGQTRFSVYIPNSNAWKASNGSRFSTEREYRDYLFAEERLRVRTHIFLSFSLPQLAKAAEGHIVRHLITYSSFLPEKYEAALKKAAKEYDFVRLSRVDSDEEDRGVEHIARELMFTEPGIDPYEPFGVYRLDDDDLLPANYFDLNSKYIQIPFVGMQVSLGTGISAIYQGGNFVSARLCYRPMLAIGFMSIQRFDPSGQLLLPKPAAHNLADRSHPVIMDSENIGFLWTRHLEQDTNLGRAATHAQQLQRMRKEMLQYPALVDFKNAHRAFPVLKGRLTSANDITSRYQELVALPVRLGRDERTFKAEPYTGSVSVNIEANCDQSSVQKNALMTFNLVDANGNKIQKSWLEDHMRQERITRSSIPSVGWFRYLKTNPGRNVTKVKFNLPKDVYLDAVAVRKWKKPGTDIVINRLEVEATRAQLS